MAAKRRSLGKGLDALLAGTQRTARQDQPPSAVGAASTGIQSGSINSAEGAGTNAEKNGLLRELALDRLQRGPYQPRRDFDTGALEELADSIRAQGVMQPIVVRPVGDEQYEILAGERRWRAAQLAQLDAVPALVRDIPDQTAMAMALIENIQREDLNPMEEAVAMQRLQSEFELTQQEVADALGKSRSAVANLLRLMTLEPEVRLLLERRDLDMGHARCLVGLEREQQCASAREIVARELSVRQAEALVRRLHQEKQQTTIKTPAALDPDIRRLQNELAEKLGARVQIDHKASGKGRVVLNYNSLDELDGILAHIRTAAP